MSGAATTDRHVWAEYFDIERQELRIDEINSEFQRVWGDPGIKADPKPDASALNAAAEREAHRLSDKLLSELMPEGSATAKALDYSLKRWQALTRYLDDGQLPIDNNWIENQIRPIALGRANWLFAGSLRAGQRAAAVMSLIRSAQLNGHDPYAYLKDILTRLPTHKASRIDELLPHNWQPQTA